MMGWPIDAINSNNKKRIPFMTVTVVTQIIIQRQRTERKLVSKVPGKVFRGKTFTAM